MLSKHTPSRFRNFFGLRFAVIALALLMSISALGASGSRFAFIDSTMAFFSSDDGVAWEQAFNLAGTVVKSDEKKKIDTLVLLREEPVAGRPLTVGKH